MTKKGAPKWRARRKANEALPKPALPDAPTWFAALDRLGSEPFMKKGRKQPCTPHRQIFGRTHRSRGFRRMRGLFWED